MTAVVRRLRVAHLLGPDGWLSPAHLDIDPEGRLTSLTREPPPGWDEEAAVSLSGYALPGMPDLHSHAFQRALVGFGQSRTEAADDSFWSWRERMYATALAIEPDELEAVAAWLYVELLEGGFTTVGEFHYLHHAPDGRPYDDRAELGRRLAAAAQQAGIALTLLPTLYLLGGFGLPPRPEQRRFVHTDTDDFLKTVDALETLKSSSPDLRLGTAAHSLRAVDPDALRQLWRARPEGVFHLHVAEQPAEVEGSLEHLGARPAAWLLDAGLVDDRTTLVHATWTDREERRRLAPTGAIVGLCPTTEADLGDGLFAVEDYCERGGAIGVGTDSHVGVSAAGELRLLEHGRRLVTGRRNVVATASGPGRHTGRRLYELAVAGGTRSLQQPAGPLAPGARADLVVLDPDHPRLVGHGLATVLDALVFGDAAGAVRDVFVGGRQLVCEGRHRARDTLLPRFRAAMQRLVERIR